MCIIAQQAHLSDTTIFTCVSATENGSPTRQLVMYQNSVTFTSKKFTENIMCLPIPLKDGLVPTDHILLYDFSSEGKGGMKEQYESFFKDVAKSFEIPTNGSWSDSRSSRSAPRSLAVVQVGGYQCSLASSPADVLNLDRSVFGDPAGMKEVLEKNYAHNFAFLVCRFKKDKGDTLKLHPIVYSHPIAQDGSLFIPTRHYHGDGAPNENFVDDWDHNIYVFGADVSSIDNCIKTSKYKKGTAIVTPPYGPFESRAWKTLDHMFKQHTNKDMFDEAKVFAAKRACKVNIRSTFSNLDFQPPALLV